MNNRYSSPILWCGVILTRLLGIVFILSAGSKAINIPAFSSEVRLYCDAYLWSEMSLWSQPIAIMVCAIEMTLGVLTFFQKCRAASLIGMLAMLSFFVWLTGINYFCPSLFGSIESCGCFGELIHFSPLGAFIKSVVLWIVCVITHLIIQKTKKKEKKSASSITKTTSRCGGKIITAPTKKKHNCEGDAPKRL